MISLLPLIWVGNIFEILGRIILCFGTARPFSGIQYINKGNENTNHFKTSTRNIQITNYFSWFSCCNWELGCLRSWLIFTLEYFPENHGSLNEIDLYWIYQNMFDDRWSIKVVEFLRTWIPITRDAERDFQIKSFGGDVEKITRGVFTKYCVFLRDNDVDLFQLDISHEH